MFTSLRVLIKDADPGYVNREQFEANQARLRENTAGHPRAHRQSALLEGSALLQGLLLCGICGQRMHPQYTARGQQLSPWATIVRRAVVYGLCHPARPLVHVIGIDEVSRRKGQVYLTIWSGGSC